MYFYQTLGYNRNIYIYFFFEKNIIIKVVKFLQNFIRFDDIWYIEIIVSNNTNVTWIKIMGSIIG